MAKVVQLEVKSYTQTEWNGFGHSFLLADAIIPFRYALSGDPSEPSRMDLLITTDIESDITLVNCDDSASEVAIDISTGKWVMGNLVCGIAPLQDIRNDVRDFVTYQIGTSDSYLFKGVANTTQSQDYVPDILADSNVLLQLTPDQVKTLIS
jgi:hypothetical protein